MASILDTLPSDDDEDQVATDSKESESEEDEEGSSESEEESCDETEDFASPKPVAITASTSTATFAQLHLSSWIVNQLKQLNIHSPTPVQQHCIPKVLEGVDVLGCAKTGTGKTLAFALPILQQLSVDPYGVFALVLTPTRELAFQIADQFKAVGAPINVKTVVVVGGRDQVDQSLELMRRPHIVVATPGRLADHLENHGEALHEVFNKMSFLVLDEADRMLDGQYAEQIKQIFKMIPKKRQTLLLSATLTSALTQLHQVSVRKPFFFEDQSQVATVEHLDQKFVLCPQDSRDGYLVHVVQTLLQKNSRFSIIIFAHSCRECQALAYMFAALNIPVGSLHSQIPQHQRLSSLTNFRSKQVRVLICTDVASRGLDIPHIDVVVNHSLPQCPKTYVHRVGRSARAGRFGCAVSLVTQYDVLLLQAVEKTVGKKLDKMEVSANKVKTILHDVLVTKREAELKLEADKFGEKKENNYRKRLLMQGMAEEEVDKVMEERKLRQHGGGRKRKAEDKEKRRPPKQHMKKSKKK